MKHPSKSSSKKLRIGIFVTIIAAIIIIIPPIAGGMQSVFLVDLTPATFNPVRTSSRTFDVSSVPQDPTGYVPQSQMQAKGIISKYTDPTHVYPGVSIFQSEPYRSMIDGTPIDTSNENASDLLATDGRLIIGDQVFYEHEYYFTEQIGVRTQFNFVDPGSTDSYISPFAGETWTVSAGNTYTDTFGLTGSGANHDVTGVLVMYDQFDWGYFFNYEATNALAKISSCMTHVYFPSIQSNPSIYDPGTTYYTPDGAIAYIRSNEGNSGIYIYPHITIQGQSNYISYGNYTYDVTLPNGTVTKLTVETTSAAVGFVDARQTGIDQQGDVPSNAPVSINLKTKADYSNPYTTSRKPVETETNAGGITHVTLNGYMHPDAAIETLDESGGYNQVLGYSTSLDNTNINIDLSKPASNFNMARNLVLTPSFYLEPKTTVYRASANIQWASDRRYTYFGVTTNDDESWTNSQTINWPCGFKIVNQWAITQFTFKVAIITRSQIRMVTSSGAPLNASAILHDFGANSIIRDPMDDMLDVNLKTPNSFDLVAAWENFVAQFGMIGAIIIIIIVIIVIAVVLVFIIYIINKLRGAFRRH